MKAITTLAGILLCATGWTIKVALTEIHADMKPILKIVIEEELREHPELKDSGKLPKIGSTQQAQVGTQQNAPVPERYEDEVSQ
jgi:hypothetical protein